MSSPLKVLIVDDEVGIQEMLDLVLSGAGYSTVVASDGRQAMEKIRAERFDIVVSDIMMPEVNGISLLESIKKAMPDTQIIIMTGYGTVEIAVGAMKKGAYDFIRKPFNMDEIVAVVRQAEERAKLAQAEKLHTDKLENLGRLTASLVHDLKSPLNGISLMVQMLLSDPEISAQQKEDFENLLQQSQACDDIVKTVLDYSRKGTGTTQQVDVKAVLQQVLRMTRQDLIDAGVEVSVDDTDQPTLLTGNAVQLQQVFMNLITNAKQAMANRSIRKLTIQTLRRRDSIRISFSDTGCGISVDHQGKIFDPFFTTKGENEGTGLGLYICRDLITQHHGLLSVESEVNRGTTFYIDLPIGDVLIKK